jgi:hypothetical protein
LAQGISFTILQHNDPQWVDFVTRQPEANIFHHPAWIGLLASSHGYHPFIAVTQNKKGQITAGLPIMEIASLTGKRRWVSLPFTDHCAPLFSSQESFEVLKENIIEKSKGQNKKDLELRWNFQSPDLFCTSEHVLTTLKLSPNQDIVAKSIEKKDFRNIKEAEKRGVQIEKGTSLQNLEAFYKMHLETRRRHGIPVQPWQFFLLLREQILIPGLGFILLAHKNGNCLSGAVYLHWNQTITYKFAASTLPGRQLLAGDLLIWQAICWGCENGFKTLDWGRSDVADSGLRQFKIRWGSDEAPLVYSRNFQMNSNGIKQRFMPVIRTMINKSPLWVCRLSGELFYRYFG